MKTKRKETRKKKLKHNVAVDPSTLSFATGDDDCALLEMVSPGGVAVNALGGDAAAVASAASALKKMRDRKGGGSDGGRTPPLQGRAAYVCRSGFCARRAIAKNGLAKSLATPAASRPRFGDALVELCVAAERLEGVESSENWDVTREPGSPSRWSALPKIVDADTREQIPGTNKQWMVFRR